MLPLTPDLLLRAYAIGIFPMARSRDDPKLYWVDPERRGVLPLENFHVPRSLAKVLKRNEFQVTCDRDFQGVLAGCAEPTAGRPDTWINEEIVRLFTRLYDDGLAHSVEVWKDGTLAGGLYGLALGGAFFGESMFSRAENASKVALVHLVARMKAGGYTLLDTQFVTDHLRQFGATEISRSDYLNRLAAALGQKAVFYRDLPLPLAEILRQESTQTS